MLDETVRLTEKLPTTVLEELRDFVTEDENELMGVLVADTDPEIVKVNETEAEAEDV
jgi:hypothetical protein